ncbi:MAG: aminodeoxychorismate/anthranilate synthase component II [Bacteroidales bacterium]|nr:aminodeoxychorismate/anthranilate synthase component II [Bacteroidales bacterium]
MKLLIVDNHDSFTWNLVQLAREAGADDITVCPSEKALASDPALYNPIIFSPGPGLPHEFPAMHDILNRFPNKRILGVCLGLQAIGIHYGARLVNMEEPQHGRQVKIKITGPDYLFGNLPSGFEAGLYHSWFLSGEDLPASLLVTAVSDDNRIMAVRHRELDIRGVQFHPESVMTPAGAKIMTNWLRGNEVSQ